MGTIPYYARLELTQNISNYICIKESKSILGRKKTGVTCEQHFDREDTSNHAEFVSYRQMLANLGEYTSDRGS
jgi:hypothetical protein